LWKTYFASLDGEGAKVVIESKAGFGNHQKNAELFAENIIRDVEFNI
jgi:hypothetical protein